MPEGIARICNAAIETKTRFRVLKSLCRRTSAVGNHGPSELHSLPKKTPKAKSRPKAAVNDVAVAGVMSLHAPT
jgi:hypothetical protein